ncbi:Signal transduction histidine kinase [Clostridium sp. DSM 8431]|uniref:sensor histidine kinase n=1 Tax=Clostridium sp. DSM 8431 TaxID=1761781 RepID=UPI0008F24294|nr:HAMP domain-containing sensor histidine kinase [Clostridium sp. DSM 8431]SFU72017.1 Signal transduction histidine kinase [Clostridium sp. DSM 8431]
MKFSIKYKFVTGFLFILCISFNFITFTVNKIVASNNEKIITDEFLTAQRDISMYLNQYFIINDKNIDLNETPNKIGLALSSKINDRIILYSKDGEFIFDSDYNNGILYLNNGISIEDDYSDLNSAIHGEAAYKISKTGEIYKVIFSKPLYVNGDNIGILRYTKDYTDLFLNGEGMIFNIKILVVAVFIMLFIFTYFLLRQITIPLIKLNKATKEIALGNFEGEVLIKSKDEIGELADSFNIMKNKIGDQIERIKRDRDDLIKSESHRKAFYDNVTHEIKTPLTIIDGYTQMILDEEELDGKLIFKAASKIKKESNKLKSMIIDILNISKLESQCSNELREKVEMKRLIETICSEMKVRADKYGISINKNLEEKIYLYANLNDLNSMIVNIIDNSIKYSNVKSTITINLFKDKENCYLLVEDEGKGIREDALQNIFAPFYRGENSLEDRKQGNGLGLAIVKSIVSKYDGKIQIESEINVGTKILIRIPLFTNWQQLN